MRKSNVSYFISEGFHGILSHGFMSFAAVGIITACLLIMGSFSLVAVNMEHNLGQLIAENQFLAYIDESLTEEQARALQREIEQVPNVASAAFVTREEAMEHFQEEMDDDDLFGDLPDDVLRHRFAIHVVDIEQMEETVAAVEQIEGVANTTADFGVAEGFVAVSRIASAIAIILIVMLLAVSLFIISNTIKLATFTRREEIAIMKMCGATNRFVRMPFIVEGIVLGLAGALIAFLLQWGIYQLIVRSIAGFQLLDLLPFGKLALPVLGVFAATGLLVGVGGSVLTIRKFLQV